MCLAARRSQSGYDCECGMYHSLGLLLVECLQSWPHLPGESSPTDARANNNPVRICEEQIGIILSYKENQYNY